MSIGGHTQDVAQATTSAAGFAIEDVKVSGNDQTSEIEILQLLGLDGTTSLVALDADAARQKIANLPWVENVEVRKVYPKAIEVKLTERKAYAIWQHGSELADPEGRQRHRAASRQQVCPVAAFLSAAMRKQQLRRSMKSLPIGLMFAVM